MTDPQRDEHALKQVTIYTDGAAVPNPGAGGYGAVLRFGGHSKELSGGYRLTTNNRMELMAVIVGLEALKERCQITLYSDSEYIVNAIKSGAVFRWRENDWTINRSGTKPAKNIDLWKRLLAAYEKHDVEMVWVKGHAGIDDNERCDTLAMTACKEDDLPPDSGYDGNPLNEGAASSTAARSKVKILEAGQPCRKCGTPVIKRTPTERSARRKRAYHYAWYLYCPGCKAMYMVEAAKIQVDDGGAK